VRKASQNVPRSRRPSTGGRPRKFACASSEGDGGAFSKSKALRLRDVEYMRAWAVLAQREPMVAVSRPRPEGELRRQCQKSKAWAVAYEREGAVYYYLSHPRVAGITWVSDHHRPSRSTLGNGRLYGPVQYVMCKSALLFGAAWVSRTGRGYVRRDVRGARGL
jgi:hypothetical protein